MISGSSIGSVQLRGEFHRDLAALTRTLMVSMLTTVIAGAGLAFGAARLI
jgi:hypothetical protein